MVPPDEWKDKLPRVAVRYFCNYAVLVKRCRKFGVPCALEQANLAEHPTPPPTVRRSHTRYKPWPKVEKFLTDLPPCSLVADAGCGNGKCSSAIPFSG